MAVLRRTAPLWAGGGLLATVLGLGLRATQGVWTGLAEGLVLGGLAALAAAGLLAPDRLRWALGGRRLRYGSNALVASLAFLAILGLLNFLAVRHPRRWDLTELKEYSLSPQTLQILRTLPGEVRFLGFFSSQDPRRKEFEDLVQTYQAYSDRVSYELIDPDARPALAREYGIVTYGEIVVEGPVRRWHIRTIDEPSFTAALLRVTRERRRTVYFLQGHGEPDLFSPKGDGLSRLRQAMEDQFFNPKPLKLLTGQGVPEDADAVVVFSPQSPLLAHELRALADYLNRGGRLFVLLDPGTRTGLEPLLEAWGIWVDDDIVIDPGVNLQGDVATPAVVEHAANPITKGLGNVFFPRARSVRLSEDGLPDGLSGFPVIYTSTASWGERNLKSRRVRYDPDDDLKGPLTLMVALAGVPKAPISFTAAAGISVTVETGIEAAPTPTPTAPAETPTPTPTPAADEGPRPTRIVVAGDADFATNAFLTNPFHRDLFLNALNWLVEEEELIGIRPKKSRFRFLFLTRQQQALLFWGTTVILPLAVALLGVWVWWRRR